MCMCVVWFQLSLLTSYAIHDLNPNHWRVHIHSTLTELSWYIFNPVCPSEKPARMYQIRDWRQSYQLFPHAARHERIEKHIHTFFPQISHQTNHLHCSTKLTNSFKRKIQKKRNSSPTNHLNLWDFDLNLQIIRATVIGPFGDFGRKSDERAVKSFHWNGSSSFINVDKITCSHYKQHIEQCSKPTSVIQKCVGYSFGRKNVDTCTFAYIHKLKYQEIMTWVHNDLLWKRKFYFVTQLWSTGWKNRMLQQVLKLGHFESTISIEMCVCV